LEDREFGCPWEVRLTTAARIRGGLIICIGNRLARLYVHEKDGRVRVKTMNVNSFSTTTWRELIELVIDGTTVPLPITTACDDQRAIAHFQAKESKTWTMTRSASSNTQYAPCSTTRSRAQAILSIPEGPLTIVVPSTTTRSHELSVALRLSHALHVYHRLDAEIIAGSEVPGLIDRTRKLTTRGNMIVVGGLETDFVRCVLGKRMTPFEVVVDSPSHKGPALRLGERPLVEPGLGKQHISGFPLS
jgi:hypothetical protein